MAGGVNSAALRVLVVEDDDGIAAPLTEGLIRAGFSVERVATGAAALENRECDIVLLDLGLPDMDGLDVCRQLRSRSDVPIVAVTARDEEIDRVLGLEMGADDYVVKPFGMRELVARIRAVTRRTATRQETPDGAVPQSIGSMEIDRRTHRVTVKGEEVALTPREFALLEYLAADPGAVRTRERIMDDVWDPHWFGPTKTLDVHIASVRRKLGDPAWIETVRGVGFRLVPPE
jgi:two-component system, OmpR family, response regulator RegX3